jgi:hypothetical protein
MLGRVVFERMFFCEVVRRFRTDLSDHACPGCAMLCFVVYSCLSVNCNFVISDCALSEAIVIRSVSGEDAANIRLSLNNRW